MGGGVSLLIILLTLAFVESKPPNSAHSVYKCEDDTSGLTCENYPGIIEILNVKFPEENADVCNNFNSISKNKRCLASESDEQKLVTELGKICDGKRSCNIHLAHGIYGSIQLPCRDLNISIRIEILYDCIYETPPPPTEPPYYENKSTMVLTRPSTTPTPTQYNSSTEYSFHSPGNPTKMETKVIFYSTSAPKKKQEEKSTSAVYGFVVYNGQSVSTISGFLIAMTLGLVMLM